MINEPFAFGHSLLHRLDPRLRVIAATLFSTVVAVAHHLPALAAALGISLLLILLARLDLRMVIRRLLTISGFLLLLALVLPLTYRGEAIFTMGGLEISRPGLILAGGIALKSVAIVLTFLALIATMTIATLGQALGRLHLPGKLVLLLLMAYRYIFVITGEYQRLYRAARIRGFRPGTNIHTYRTYAYLIGMLFVRATDRAERVHRAMRCRGFNGTFHSLYTFPPSRLNWAFAATMTVATLALLLMEWLPS